MTTDPISAVLDGVLLGAEDLQGIHPWKASTEQIISACTRLVEDYGIILQGSSKDCSDSRFQLGGDDEFRYSDHKDDDGNPAVLIEVTES
ncbi:hypothetical protein [Synechococcus sp. UW179A]|uniref:hypothetical protein n=1 Tax=Synechococcus sp. UW179A TaxID=2575510 RepID=UPI000E0F23D3|nr:hypothetical protein [Synechococcus sp. UW179A]